jgi:hypothetical protein
LQFDSSLEVVNRRNLGSSENTGFNPSVVTYSIRTQIFVIHNLF